MSWEHSRGLRYGEKRGDESVGRRQEEVLPFNEKVRIWIQITDEKGVVPGTGQVLRYSLLALNINLLLLLQFFEQQNPAKDGWTTSKMGKS